MDFQWRTQFHRVTSTLPVVIGMLGLFCVLMVVFLICSQRVSLPGTSIDLPRFDNEELTPLVKTVITVTADGTLFYNASRLKDLEAFNKVLLDLAQKYQEGQAKLEEPSPERRPKVVFYVDQNAPLSTVTQLFDIARGAKFDAYLATNGASLRNNKNYVPSLDENDGL